LHSLKGRTEV
jgi:integrase